MFIKYRLAAKDSDHKNRNICITIWKNRWDFRWKINIIN